MIGAMMLPLLAAPLAHLHQRSLSQRRLRACLLFLAAYFAVWLAVLAVLGQAASWLAPRPGSAAPYALLAAAGIALCWQGTPAKRRFLNAAHVHPPLPAFGVAAEWGSLRFGASHAASCVGSCWALMLVPLASPQGHLALMGLVGAALLYERHAHPRPVAADRPMLLAGICALATASIWCLAA
jgi:predicted metal-binding membrane protein